MCAKYGNGSSVCVCCVCVLYVLRVCMHVHMCGVHACVHMCVCVCVSRRVDTRYVGRKKKLMRCGKHLAPYIRIVPVGCCDGGDGGQWSMVLRNGDVVEVLPKHWTKLVADDRDEDTGLRRARWLAVVTGTHDELQQDSNQQHLKHHLLAFNARSAIKVMSRSMFGSNHEEN